MFDVQWHCTCNYQPRYNVMYMYRFTTTCTSTVSLHVVQCHDRCQLSLLVQRACNGAAAHVTVMALPCERGNVAHALHTESRCIDNVLPMPGFLLVNLLECETFAWIRLIIRYNGIMLHVKLVHVCHNICTLYRYYAGKLIIINFKNLAASIPT